MIELEYIWLWIYLSHEQKQKEKKRMKNIYLQCPHSLGVIDMSISSYSANSM